MLDKAESVRTLYRKIAEVSGNLSTRKIKEIELIDFSDIDIFCNLSRNNNIRITADRLNISDRTIHRAISKINSSAGQKMMCTTPPSNAQLTEIGKIVLPDFLSILYLAREIEALSHAPANCAIKIGILTFGKGSILPFSISAYHKRNPHVAIRTVSGEFEVLTQLLRSGEIGAIFGVLRSPDMTPDLEQVVISQQRLAIVARADHPILKAKAQGICIADLAPFPWVMADETSPVREAFEVSYRLNGLPPPVPAIETMELEVIFGKLEMSDALTVLCHADYSRLKQFAEVPAIDFAGSVPVGLTVKSKNSVNTNLQLLVHFIGQRLQELGHLVE
ncbi:MULTISPECIES: LysR substrate-binding domain-containing protein [Burkholderia cepacia complex]|uniref:LysR substrate-binding domain-containing protein n=1 Tax=Burkholderia cepacia complex TaxID=87882 RepID=UPI0022EB7544|nr:MULTISPECIES: LysR substrate-binding domain-containing protein [Burkholderia cepacia complex]MDA3672497.1 LysR substrate-binding domain-containing protein [Burkholderia cenocepacia]MDA3681470.1 LysR substrate-binding domain-containing protein [Burkholderia cenocepacia]MDA3689295.1 LysR substrate-binding domain-containing protein [Burkholderia cenocepacia]MDA3696781.1 LysR substrate-binding domain-containing protein [Burkholderia cenocepacia]MDA3704105.1 LysR substrate-binding domain-contain